MTLDRVPLQRRDGTVIAHALVEASDYARVAKHVWRRSSDGYAVRSETSNGTKRTVYLHRVVAGTPPGWVTDHINGDRLDNRRANLRTATPAQNAANSRDRPRRSGLRGVYWHGQARRWVSQISVNGRLRHLGLFDDPEDAARAYDVAARDAWGPYARTNGLA